MDCSSTHRKLSRADGLFRVSLASQYEFYDALWVEKNLALADILGDIQDAGEDALDRWRLEYDRSK